MSLTGRTRRPAWTLRRAPFDHGGMSFFDRLFPGIAFAQRSQAHPAPQVIPPARDSRQPATLDNSVTLIPVYRALQILGTAASQLSIQVKKNGVVVDSDSLVLSPSLSMSRAKWIEANVMSLAAAGNCYWRLVRQDSAVLDIQVLSPWEVQPVADKAGRITYRWNGRSWGPDEIRHLWMLKLPGSLTGLGPIQAARHELGGALDLRDHTSRYFSGSGIPDGILSSDQVLSAADAARASNLWQGRDPEGEPLPGHRNGPGQIRVLGKGLKFEPLLVSPKDAQWLDAKAFTTTDIARLFGVPASLMLATLEGNSQTYANVEQEWLGFARFTLMTYLSKIEDELTQLIPRGRSAHFNIEALLRTDTRSRYEAHGTALAAGFLTVNEVRAIEGLPPLSEAELSQLKGNNAHAH